MKLEVPQRAQYLRVVWSELSRMHSHLMWLGFTSDAFGFEALFMHCWRMREKILDIIEETSGGRVIFGCAKIGGVRKDIDNATLGAIVSKLQSYREEIEDITDVFLNDASVSHRLCGRGILEKEEAHFLGAVGPVMRASGWASDTRKTGYAAYKDIALEPQVESAGDCYARCKVRIREIFQSIEIIRQVAQKIPSGAVEMKVTGLPQGEYFCRTEQPRGEVIYYAKANGTKFLERLRIRTPTFANIPALLKLLHGVQLADVPVIILTIDPCISCAER
jgi:ech hydrogenase subunit E